MAKNKNQNINEPEKSIEELAREAMDAIKESERAQRRKEQELIEQETIKREEELKMEIKRKIQKKMKLLEEEEIKEAKKEELDTRFLVNWKNPDEKGINYEGEYNETPAFKIKRGILLYHLYIVGKDIITESWRKRSHTSVSLYSLKKKADDILKNSIKNSKPKNDKK
ncbi:MAG: hypothetical protein AABY15_04145 [Nanoarchaeota archaeon]